MCRDRCDPSSQGLPGQPPAGVGSAGDQPNPVTPGEEQPVGTLPIGTRVAVIEACLFGDAVAQLLAGSQVAVVLSRTQIKARQATDSQRPAELSSRYVVLTHAHLVVRRDSVP